MTHSDVQPCAPAEPADRFLGCLLGQAVGAALGAPFGSVCSFTMTSTESGTKPGSLLCQLTFIRLELKERSSLRRRFHLPFARKKSIEQPSMPIFCNDLSQMSSVIN